MIFLFYLNQLKISQNFLHILIHAMLHGNYIHGKLHGKPSFLDVEGSRQQGKFMTSVYKKPTFSDVYTHFDRFLLTVYKVGMINTLAYRCFKICFDWVKFHEELVFLKHVFLKNGYPLSFIEKCFKIVINKLVIQRPQVTTVEKKTLIL